jgi:hypothetical protein
MVEPHSLPNETAVTYKPKKLRYFKFSIRAMLVVITVVAGVAWWFSPERVEYHTNIASWKRDGNNWVQIQNVWGHGERTITYASFAVENVNFRAQWDSVGPIIHIISVDLDDDGFFDEERYELYAKGKIPSKTWTKIIHIPVPKTSP